MNRHDKRWVTFMIDNLTAPLRAEVGLPSRRVERARARDASERRRLVAVGALITYARRSHTSDKS